MEEEDFSDIISGHTSKSRFSFQKDKSHCVLGFDDSGGNETLLVCRFSATPSIAGKGFFFTMLKH